MAEPNPSIQILVQRQPVDEALLGECVSLEATGLGVDACLTWSDDLTASLESVCAELGPDDELVLVTSAESSDLADLPGGSAHRTIRVDLAARSPDRSPHLAAHIQGRGIDGVRWAMRAMAHRRRWPVRHVSYGEHPEQFAELRLPEPAAAVGPAPIVVLLHGGFWRSRWQLDLMDALAVDLPEHGLASWNVEYRRPDRHGWAATIADVEAAVRHVERLAEQMPVDPARVALLGHSAGGQLAARVAADLLADGTVLRPVSLVQLAGVVDLIETQRRNLGEGAVSTALGGSYEQVPDVYAAASPILRLPIGTRQIVVTARADSPDLNEMNRRYVATARAAGDEVTWLEGDGDHFTLIDPGSRIWEVTLALLGIVLSFSLDSQAPK